MSEKTEIKAYAPLRGEVENAKSAAHSFDYEDKDGNKAARSHVHSLRLLKGKVEAARKDGKAASLAFGRRVDGEAKEITTEIESLIEVHAAPLKEIEQRESDRVAAIKDRLSWLEQACSSFDQDGDPFGSNYLLSKLAEARAVPLDDSWGEFLAEAGQAKDATVSALEHHAQAAQKREQEAIELQRLREQLAGQLAQRKRIEDAATAKAKADAEQLANRQREAHEQALRDVEITAQKERDNAARVLNEQREAAEKRELEMRLEGERKERERREAEDDAKAEKEARERDEANREKIHSEIVSALVKSKLTPRQAAVAVAAMMNGSVPHVSINY